MLSRSIFQVENLQNFTKKSPRLILGGRFSWPLITLDPDRVKAQGGPCTEASFACKVLPSMCWREVPLHAQGPPYSCPGARKSNLCTWLGAGQLQEKKTSKGFLSIYKTRAMLLCLSHAFIQLQSVCASLELHTAHPTVSTAVYVSTFYKSLFGSPSADTSEGHALFRSFWIFRYQLLPWRKSRICFCSSHVSSLRNLKFSSVFLKLAGF
jgi:hypothetical protein